MSKLTPKTRREFAELVSRTCDGTAGAGELAELERLLQEFPELHADYVKLAVVDSLLQQRYSQPLQPLDHLPTSEPASEANEKTATRTAPPILFEKLGLAWVVPVLGITLLSLVALWGIRSRTVAKVVEVLEVTWNENGEYQPGDRLQDTLSFEAGVVTVRFADGAHVSLVGPVRFRPTGRNEAELLSGTIDVHMSKAKHGFTVQAGEFLIEDLGTAFRLQHNGENQATLMVTEGRVRMQVGSDDSIIASAGDVVVGDLEATGGRLSSAKQDRWDPQASGQFKVLHESPRSLAINQFQRDDEAVVFLESSHRRLQRDVPVNLSAAGSFSSFDQITDTIAAGAPVDCYLVHCDPLSKRHEVRGSLTFPGKILGVITEHDRLNGTNGVLGARASLRCQHKHRGLESEPEASADHVTISADGRTITAVLRTKAVDQFRILVERYPYGS